VSKKERCREQEREGRRKAKEPKGLERILLIVRSYEFMFGRRHSRWRLALSGGED